MEIERDFHEVQKFEEELNRGRNPPLNAPLHQAPTHPISSPGVAAPSPSPFQLQETPAPHAEEILYHALLSILLEANQSLPSQRPMTIEASTPSSSEPSTPSPTPTPLPIPSSTPPSPSPPRAVAIPAPSAVALPVVPSRAQKLPSTARSDTFFQKNLLRRLLAPATVPRAQAQGPSSSSSPS